MNARSIIGLTLAFTILLSLFACRKNIEFFVEGKESPSSNILESAKVWRAQYLSKSPIGRKGALRAVWRDSWTVRSSNGEMLLVVPGPEQKIKNKNFTARRFSIFNISGNVVTNGRIVEFIGEKINVEEHLASALSNLGKNLITKFNGVISEYDLNYRFINSLVYRNGSKTNLHARVENFQLNELNPLKAAQKSKSVIMAARSSTNCDFINPISMGYPSAYECDSPTVTSMAFYEYDENGCLTFLEYYYLGHTCPMPPGGSGDDSEGSNATATSEQGEIPPYGGSGDGGGGTSTAANALEIIDAIQNPCLKDALAMTRNTDINGKIAEILDKLADDPKVKVYMFDKDTLSLNPPARTSNAKITTFTDNTKLFEVSITLNRDVLVNPDGNSTSKEFAVGVIIHEAVHAYFRLTGNNPGLQAIDHAKMANDYIKPMAQYLHGVFGISLVHASAIAWRGVADTPAFTQAPSFEVGEGANKVVVSKSDMTALGTQYYINQIGRNICAD